MRQYILRVDDLNFVASVESQPCRPIILQAAARILLQDWNSGRIPYYTVPPVRESIVADSATLVTQYTTEFNTKQVWFR